MTTYEVVWCKYASTGNFSLLESVNWILKKLDGAQKSWDLGFFMSGNYRWVFQLIAGFWELESEEQDCVRGNSAWKVVAEGFLWRQLEVVHLLVVGEVWILALSCLCFLSFEVLKVRLCPVSAPSPLNAHGREKFRNFPCSGFCMSCLSSWEPSRPGTTRTWGCSPKYEGQCFGDFLELFISKDLQTGQNSVLRNCWCHLGGRKIAEDVHLQVLGFCFLPELQLWYLGAPSCRLLGEAWIAWVVFGKAVKLQKSSRRCVNTVFFF